LWCCGVVVLWCCGVVVLWCCGVVVLWCCGVAWSSWRCCGVELVWRWAGASLEARRAMRTQRRSTPGSADQPAQRAAPEDAGPDVVELGQHRVLDDVDHGLGGQDPARAHSAGPVKGRRRRPRPHRRCSHTSQPPARALRGKAHPRRLAAHLQHSSSVAAAGSQAALLSMSSTATKTMTMSRWKRSTMSSDAMFHSLLGSMRLYTVPCAKAGGRRPGEGGSGRAGSGRGRRRSGPPPGIPPARPQQPIPPPRPLPSPPLAPRPRPSSSPPPPAAHLDLHKVCCYEQAQQRVLLGVHGDAVDERLAHEHQRVQRHHAVQHRRVCQQLVQRGAALQVVRARAGQRLQHVYAKVAEDLRAGWWWWEGGGGWWWWWQVVVVW
jgi:hypothetical protein